MKKKILIVDDEPDILKTMKYNLEFEGYEVFSAQDGEEGLKKINQALPDLVLLDLKMPGKNGFQVAKEIKSQKEYRDIPIIVLSALKDEASKYIAAKGGAVEFIEKPVDIEKLKFHIKDILNQ